MPTGNLPESAKKIWETVYDKAKADGDNEETAARKAWGAVKNAGWEKDNQGEWHKTSLAQFSLNVKKAVLDDKGDMCWRADTSDTETDLYNDNMSLELYNDFLKRIESGELPPEQYCSDFWRGGNPYLSVSHYPDLNGKAVPGVVESVYVDGKFLKAKGKFYNNELGKACFMALQDDLNKIKATSKFHDGRVRVSIAFLDWSHRHKSESGYVFERKSLSDFCPECLKEILEGVTSGKTYLKGQLVHLALTRVPVNTRTIMEVDRSMTTRKEDAASIIGDELAETIDKDAKGLKAAALVEFSDTDDPAVIENSVKSEKDEEESETDKEEKDEEEEKGKEYKAILEQLSTISSKLEHLESLSVNVSTRSDGHPLDEAYTALKASYDAASGESGLTDDEKLKMFQEPFEAFGSYIVSSLSSKKRSVVELSENTVSTDLADALSGAIAKALQPISDKLELVSTKLESRATTVSESPNPRPIVPPRRSIEPRQEEQIRGVAKSVTPVLRGIIEKTTQ